MHEEQFSVEECELINSIRGSIHRALWGEVIPSMRKIILHFESGAKSAIVNFYHHGEITDSIEEHYASIMTEVSADAWEKPIKIDYEIIRTDYPELLPKEQFVVYLRKEPFVDPL